MNIKPKTLIIIWIAVMLVFSSITAYSMHAMLPQKPKVTRAALAKKVISAYNIPLIKDLPTYFRDVPKKDKYYDYVQTAYYLGFIESKNKMYFKPKAYTNDATRHKAFYFAAKFKIALDLKRKNTEAPNWLKPEIEEALDRIVTAYTSTNSLDLVGVYEPMPNLTAIKNAGEVSLAKSTKIKQISESPQWFLAAEKISVTSPAKFAVKDDTGALVAYIEPSAAVDISYKDGNYVLGPADGKYYAGASSAVRISPAGTPKIVEFARYKDANYNGTADLNKFRGDAVIAYSSHSNRLWAINELPVEEYLKGLQEGSVADSLEYLKVLTIASRSYAYHYVLAGGKHAGEPFHLKNSRNGNGNDQVYVGYNVESIIKNQIQAVEATAGQVATYNDKVIIAPYSAGTDGKRTRTAVEVWGRNDMPWTQSTPDPHGYIPNWATLQDNHMVGLSAQGARGFISKERKTYDWVLKYYFKGVEIKKMDTNQKIRIAIYSIPPAG